MDQYFCAAVHHFIDSRSLQETQVYLFIILKTINIPISVHFISGLMNISQSHVFDSGI